jgi:hypothetical protein
MGFGGVDTQGECELGKRKQTVRKRVDLQFGEDHCQEGFPVLKCQRYYTGLVAVLMTFTSFETTFVITRAVVERIGPTQE